MPLNYSVIEIHINEEARYHNKPLCGAIIDYIRKLKIAARCMVAKGIDACYENGEISTRNILTLSFNMPLKIEIILPTPELDQVLPVLENMTDQGIIAYRPMQVYCHKMKKTLIPRQIRVRDIMTSDIEKVEESTPLNQVLKILLPAIFTGVPVVNEKNNPVGIITQGDLIERAGMPLRIGLLEESEPDHIKEILEKLSWKRAMEVMTCPSICIKEDEPVGVAVDIMLKKKVKRLPVMNDQGMLIGMLSRLDIFQTITKESPDWNAFKKQNVHIDNLCHVSDIMRRDTCRVSPETTVEKALRLIMEHDIQRLAVVDGSDMFKGLISDRDLLQAFGGHAPGVWDFLTNTMPFAERGAEHKSSAVKIHEKTVADMMVTDLFTVTEDTDINEAIRLMVEKRIKRLPVLDTDGRFQGMISRDSLLRTGFAGDNRKRLVQEKV